MGKRLRTRPIGIVLMPGYNSTMVRRLAEQLVMPKAHSAAQQLRRRHRECRVPQQIVESGSDSPSTQSVKEHRFRITRFVGVIFVKELVAFMRRISQLRQLLTQGFHLPVVHDSDAAQVPVFVEERKLLFGQAEYSLLLASSRSTRRLLSL